MSTKGLIVWFGVIFLMGCLLCDLLGRIMFIGKERPVLTSGIVAFEAVATILALWVLYVALGFIK